MKIITYMCENCFEPYEFNEDDKTTDYNCPICGEKMMYWSTEEIDPITKKVINSYDEDDRRIQNPGKPVSSEFSHLIKPTVTCPYCKSTNTNKITSTAKVVHTALFGIFALGKTTKQFHCNDCKADF